MVLVGRVQGTAGLHTGQRPPPPLQITWPRRELCWGRNLGPGSVLSGGWQNGDFLILPFLLNLVTEVLLQTRTPASTVHAPPPQTLHAAFVRETEGPGSHVPVLRTIN